VPRFGLHIPAGAIAPVKVQNTLGNSFAGRVGAVEMIAIAIGSHIGPPQSQSGSTPPTQASGDRAQNFAQHALASQLPVFEMVE
jgi:hypothetical protein